MAENKKAIIPSIVVDPLQYQADRQAAFNELGNQFDMQYWDLVNNTTTWKDAVTKIKSDFPKE
jgi:hypothetical protein